jgi:AraC family transcriptional regulator
VKIDVLERAPARVAYLRYVGAYGEPLGRFWRGTVSGWLADHGLLDCPRYGIALDDPRNTPAEQCRYDACVELPDGLGVPDAQELTVAGGRYAVTFFKGRAFEMSAAWSAFAKICIARGLATDTTRPPFEHYPRGAGFDAKTGVFVCLLCVPVVARQPLEEIR